MKYKKFLLITIGNLVALFILLSEVKAQPSDVQGYIYGKVTTLDSEYQGQIRWGDEEAYWNDYFNSVKVRDPYYQRLADRHKDEEEDNEVSWTWDFSRIWEDRYSNTSHVFSCQFGDIKTLEDFGRSYITVGLKNGAKIRLNGGSNDIGANIQMQDEELGEIKITWSRIREVEFLPTPRNLEIKGGGPIYGTIETFRKGTFTGFIQWDHDERQGDDVLDGDIRNEDLSIPFKNIRYIEKQGNGCDVELNSGRRFYLTNSNDVDNDNNGIIVTVPGVGKIDIPWKYFRSATFEPAPNSGQSYNDYPTPKGLFGTVYSIDGTEYRGKIVYDIDEIWELETLDGNDDDVEYKIAFRHVKSIIPKNYAYSMVELRNGDKILLGDTQDVSDSNDGILVFQNPDEEPIHIPWKKLAEVVFD